MNRRSFFKWLGAGAAAAVVAPSAFLVAESSLSEHSIGMGPHDEGYHYENYTNFSDFALKSAIDDVVANTAKELGAAAGRDIAALHMRAFS